MAEQPRNQDEITPGTPHAGESPEDEKRRKERFAFDVARVLDLPADVAENVRDVWMAGIGALTSVEEAGRAVFEDLVRKGEQWELAHEDRLTRVRKQAAEIGEKPLKVAAEAEGRIQRLVEGTVEAVLRRLAVPSREEVRELRRRVEELSERVDLLVERLPPAQTLEPSETQAPVFRVLPGEGGWVIEEEGRAQPIGSHPSVGAAVAAARERARNEAPSTLIILNQDGSEEDRVRYAGGEDSGEGVSG